MGSIQLQDKLHRLIHQQVADGHAASEAAFLEDAILRFVEDARAEEEI
jgi:hypothetical protein